MPTRKKTSKSSSISKRPLRAQKATVNQRKKALPVAAKKVAAVPVKQISKAEAKVIATRTKKTFTIRSLHLGTQLAIAASAMVVLLALGYVQRGTFSTLLTHASSEPVTATIGIENDDPLSLAILFARKEASSYVSISNKSIQTIHVSVPSSWTRLEVTGAPLSEVTQDIPVFGFTRWTLPPRAGMRMAAPVVPDNLFFDSPSKATTAIDLRTVNLDTSAVSSRTVLVQKQTLVPLWTTGD
jgi:hypothetical protein